MRNDFEAAASAVIEVDLYHHSNKSCDTLMTANVSAIDFKAGCGNTGVDLCWYLHKDFNKLTDNQKDELREWMKSQEGKKSMKEAKRSLVLKGRMLIRMVKRIEEVAI